MAQLLNRVEPGDVITAEMWNLVVDAINALLQSGQTTGILVTGLLPSGASSDPIRVAGPLQITGKSFGYSLGQSSVAFEALSGGKIVVPYAQMLSGSSDTKLLLMVPPIPGLPQAGATMNVRVSNGVAEDVRSAVVAPMFIPVQGDVFVNWRADVTNPNPNPVSPNQQALFNFQLQASINMPATFDLSANITNATAPLPPDLVSSIEFRDESNTLITNKRIDLGKNETRNIIVRIPVIPTALNSQTFTLVITASSGIVTNTESRTLTVGVQVPQQDPSILIQQTGSVVFDVNSGNPDSTGGRFEGGIIKLKTGKRMFMQFNETRLGLKGDYDLTIKAKDGTTLVGWSPLLVNTPATITTSVDNDATVRLLQFTVEPVVGATPTGVVVFQVKRRTAANAWFKEFGVQLL